MSKSGKCYDACFRYWAKNQYSPLFICPGCETWSDKDGKTWWRVNLPDGIEIHPMEVDNG